MPAVTRYAPSVELERGPDDLVAAERDQQLAQVTGGGGAAVGGQLRLADALVRRHGRGRSDLVGREDVGHGHLRPVSAVRLEMSRCRHRVGAAAGRAVSWRSSLDQQVRTEPAQAEHDHDRDRARCATIHGLWCGRCRIRPGRTPLIRGRLRLAVRGSASGGRDRRGAGRTWRTGLALAAGRPGRPGRRRARGHRGAGGAGPQGTGRRRYRPDRPAGVAASGARSATSGSAAGTPGRPAVAGPALFGRAADRGTGSDRPGGGRAGGGCGYRRGGGGAAGGGGAGGGPGGGGAHGEYDGSGSFGGPPDCCHSRGGGPYPFVMAHRLPNITTAPIRREGSDRWYRRSRKWPSRPRDPRARRGKLVR